MHAVGKRRHVFIVARQNADERRQSAMCAFAPGLFMLRWVVCAAPLLNIGAIRRRAPLAIYRFGGSRGGLRLVFFFRMDLCGDDVILL